MKNILLFALLYFTATYTFAQDATKSDLYLKVVEVMKKDLGYSYDSTSNVRPKPNPIANSLKLEDVESIKAEKDPKITMMYGEWGKRGVVFITTKKGSKK